MSYACNFSCTICQLNRQCTNPVIFICNVTSLFVKMAAFCEKTAAGKDGVCTRGVVVASIRDRVRRRAEGVFSRLVK